MALKAEIVSKHVVKPSSPTPNHLRHFKLSLLDEMAFPFYVPIILFYSASDVVRAFGTDFETMSHNLKTSLSHTLTIYYPFCGTMSGNSIVECNDEGVLYTESKIPIELSKIFKTPQILEINELLPFDPYSPTQMVKQWNMAIQLNQFRCGGIAIGVCFTHRIADASTVALFLDGWASISRGDNNKVVPPQMEVAAQLFPPKNIEMDITSGMIGLENIVTKRFIFNDTNISRLRQKIARSNFNPTRVEAVTAIIWKSSLEAAKSSSGEEKFPTSILSHAVNIRNRMVPTLSKHSIGNLWQLAVSSLVELELGLHDLAQIVRNTIKKIDGDYIRKLQGVDFAKVFQSLMETKIMTYEKDIPCYGFSSWITFDFYQMDFGWGKPTYVRTIGLPIKNVTILMATKFGNGIEAWVTLTTRDMVQFEHNSELLEFASSLDS